MIIKILIKPNFEFFYIIFKATILRTKILTRQFSINFPKGKYSRNLKKETNKSTRSAIKVTAQNK